MSNILKALKRESYGKSASRAARKHKNIPAVIYGKNKKNTHIYLNSEKLQTLYNNYGFFSTSLELEIDGNAIKVLPKSVDLNPVSGLLRHIDFVYLASGENPIQKVSVPIVFEGKFNSIGVKRGGFFSTVRRRINLACPAGSIPPKLTIDVEKYMIGKVITTEDFSLPPGCKILDKNGTVYGSIIGRKGKSEESNSDDTAKTATK